MSRRKRHPKDPIRPLATTNACGKVGFWDRRAARQAGAHMAGEHVRPYRCDTGCGLWHLGHLPRAVLDGTVTADEWYGGDRSEADQIEIANGEAP